VAARFAGQFVRDVIAAKTVLPPLRESTQAKLRRKRAQRERARRRNVCKQVPPLERLSCIIARLPVDEISV